MTLVLQLDQETLKVLRHVFKFFMFAIIVFLLVVLFFWNELPVEYDGNKEKISRPYGKLANMFVVAIFEIRFMLECFYQCDMAKTKKTDIYQTYRALVDKSVVFRIFSIYWYYFEPCVVYIMAWIPAILQLSPTSAATSIAAQHDRCTVIFYLIVAHIVLVDIGIYIFVNAFKLVPVKPLNEDEMEIARV